jgi:toluene monooxygenase system protein D
MSWNTPSEPASDYDSVGPVLRSGALARAVVAAISELNGGAKVVDRGAYLRVLVPGRCVVTREALERAARRSVRLPGELEAIMPSFKGVLSIDEEQASWELHQR